MSSVGRRYGLSVSLLFRWRRQLDGAVSAMAEKERGSGIFYTAADWQLAGNAVGILEGKHQMKRRITMIARFDRKRRCWTLLAAACGLRTFDLIWTMTRGGPVNATHLMATLSYQRAILGGYLGGGSTTGPQFLPARRSAVSSLISLFEIEKVFYELKYELNNRPDWVWIPLRGIARLTEAGPSGES